MVTEHFVESFDKLSVIQKKRVTFNETTYIYEFTDLEYDRTPIKVEPWYYKDIIEVKIMMNELLLKNYAEQLLQQQQVLQSRVDNRLDFGSQRRSFLRFDPTATSRRVSLVRG